MQPGIEYYYECTDQCDVCPMRFTCYTTKTNVYPDGSRHMTFTGFPLLDLLMVKARIVGMIKMMGHDSSSWSGFSG